MQTYTSTHIHRWKLSLNDISTNKAGLLCSDPVEGNEDTFERIDILLQSEARLHPHDLHGSV